MTDYWQNEQFGEDDDERAERQRIARIKSRCAVCGGNPKIGKPHAPECMYADRPMPSPNGTK